MKRGEEISIWKSKTSAPVTTRKGEKVDKFLLTSAVNGCIIIITLLYLYNNKYHFSVSILCI